MSHAQLAEYIRYIILSHNIVRVETAGRILRTSRGIHYTDGTTLTGHTTLCAIIIHFSKPHRELIKIRLTRPHAANRCEFYVVCYISLYLHITFTPASAARETLVNQSEFNPSVNIWMAFMFFSVCSFSLSPPRECSHSH